jgi:hypothetical protein
MDSSTIRASVNPAAHPSTTPDDLQVIHTATPNTSPTTITTPTKRPASPNVEGESPAKRQKTEPVVTLSPVKYPADRPKHSTVLLGPSGFGAFGLGM